MKRMPQARGAALLTALLIVTLVTTLAAAMLWRQARSIQIESAERGRAQSDWVLQGALDWARLILREDLRANQNASNKAVDYNGEVWAVPLAEAKLASFLSTDDNHSADNGPDAFLSGKIEDAQGLYNLYNLAAQETPGAQTPQTQIEIARSIFTSAGLSASLADEVQKKLKAAWPKSTGNPNQGDPSPAPDATAALLPMRVEQLTWLGLTNDQIDRLKPFVTLLPPQNFNVLPSITKVNINTAKREVLKALHPNMSLVAADRIIRAREAKGIAAPDMENYLDQNVDIQNVSQYTSEYFFVTGQLRLDDRLVTMRSLVQRVGLSPDGIRVLDRQYVQQSTALISGQGK